MPNYLDIFPDYSKYELAKSDHITEIQKFRTIYGEAAVPDLIQYQMPAILTHYIECTWGARYNTKFKELIQPYLNNAGLLDQVLRSRVIKAEGNVIIGRTGARIFPELLIELKKCKSTRIIQYLEHEFA